MAIKYLPRAILRRMAPAKAVERLVTQKLTVNRIALRSLSRAGVLSQKKLTEITLKVINQYRDRKANELEDGATIPEATETALADKKLLVQRVNNASVHEVTQEIKRQYHGEFYEWLPSTAAVPDEIHMLNYGKVFQLGKGEMPGDRYGCQCGMKILVDDDTLNL